MFTLAYGSKACLLHKYLMVLFTSRVKLCNKQTNKQTNKHNSCEVSRRRTNRRICSLQSTRLSRPWFLREESDSNGYFTPLQKKHSNTFEWSQGYKGQWYVNGTSMVFWWSVYINSCMVFEWYLNGPRGIMASGI